MGYFASPQTPFSLLPKTRTPWTEFVFSTGTQACVVAFLVWLRMLHPEILSAPPHPYLSTQLVSAPAPVNHQPQPRPQLNPIVAHLDPPENALRLPAPRPSVAKVEEAPAPTVNVAPRKLDPLPVNSAPVVPKVVATNVFSTGSSATPTISRAPSQVQTGGFGDPNGIPARGVPGKAVTIAALGSFDLPSGGGYGNGSSGTKGARGVVTSTGFGNGTATGDNHPRTSQSAVQQSGFGDADVPAPPSVHSHPAETTAAPGVPAEIISKPVPVYTQEARNLRIQGEVLLEVVLQASGNLHVVRVVRGLGHGLDDNAVKAAEQIRFRPATKNGQPADSTVVLHIVFQLA
ncbi:MAG: TonB family protein [Candidatus Sulfotelmatobacter sp.]|jgi:TonB family protein